ncbi:CinA family protein [Thiogranum longum]
MAQTLSDLVAGLAHRLQQRGEMLATAESCTGGWVAKVCTDAPGSSAWFERGLVTYSNASKQELVDVSADTLAQFGAVSEQTVREMVVGLLHHSHAQWGLAISGIAGPGGGSADKPVGTVWVAWAGPGDWTRSQRFYFEGVRDDVRQQAVAAALSVLSDRVGELP